MVKKTEPAKPRLRLVILSLLVVVVSTLGCFRLFQYQIVDGEKYYKDAMNNIVSEFEETAARGEILDRNFKPIVVSQTRRNIVFESTYMTNENANATILKVIQLLDGLQEEWIKNLPVYTDENGDFQFLSGESETEDQQVAKSITALKEAAKVNVYASANETMASFYEQMLLITDAEGNPTGYKDEEMLQIAEVRFGMEKIEFFTRGTYTFAEDMSETTVSVIRERSGDLPGVNIEEESDRIYTDGSMAPHLIGQTSLIPAEELQAYLDKGYSMNERVGISGIEMAMENALRGEKGRKVVYQNADRIELEESYTEDAVPGNIVQLTLDSDLQLKMQDVLAQFINQDASAKAGAIAVLDVKTGEALALATYPSYNLEDLKNNYSEVVNRENNPLYNRAVNGQYRPGSTFKTVTASAGLIEGIITKNSTYTCNRTWMRFAPSYTPKCTGHHGAIAVERAVRKSCNIFFYELGYRLGMEKIVEYANAMGLGADSNFEMNAAKGQIITQESLNLRRPADASQSAIGQLEIEVSPLQMAVQAMTIANKGVRYEPRLVKALYSYKEEIIEEKQPVVASQLDNSTGAFDIVTNGMVQMGADLGMANLAAKSGTPQKLENGRQVYNSAVIGFYPANDPQYAVSIYVENSNKATKYLLPKVVEICMNRTTEVEQGFFRNLPGHPADQQEDRTDDTGTE